MRQLKFRAWHKKENKWLFGYEYPNLGGFSLIGEVVLMGELNSIKLEDWNNIEIMQFTGRKDKLGKDIYEGDIVRYLDAQNNSTECGSDWIDIMSIGNIFFDNEYCQFDVTGRWSIGLEEFFDQISEFCEVIGNIYENPELLKTNNIKLHKQ